MKLPRSWVFIESANKGLSASYSSPKLSGIKVLQWNVLADGLAQNGNFVNVTRKVQSFQILKGMHRFLRRCWNGKGGGR